LKITTEPVLYRILVFVLLLVFVVHRGYYNRKFPPSEDETTDKLGSSRGSTLSAIIFSLALVATILYIFFPHLISWTSIPLPAWVRWSGVGIATAGFLLLESSHRALGQNWSDQPRITESQQLVQSGPYQWIRHPIYSSLLLILGSTLLITANWFVGGLWIVTVSSDGLIRIRYEEAAMLKKFGEEYKDYQSRTGLLLPRSR
jgi:protein-S-isoprenylcysteine O-methyltransferase Ste14